MCSRKPEYVILIDKDDQAIGIGEKMKVHREGLLHRAFSIFVFNSSGSLLIQQRVMGKYHCAGLWSNSCCSHPRPDEPLNDAAHRRLQQEMGFDCELTYLNKFTYNIKFENNLIEHEIDHIFYGVYNGKVKLNPEEVADYQWIGKNDLNIDLERNPEKYAPWFKIALEIPFGISNVGYWLND